MATEDPAHCMKLFLENEQRSFREFRGPFFYLQYPDHWETIILEDIPSFFDPDGGGALQIAAFQRQGDNADPDTEIKIYLERQKIDYDPEKIVQFQTATGLSGAACEYMKEGRFWMVNVLGKDEKYLIVMYNADLVPDQHTAVLLSGIIQTIQIDGRSSSEDLPDEHPGTGNSGGLIGDYE